MKEFLGAETAHRALAVSILCSSLCQVLGIPPRILHIDFLCLPLYLKDILPPFYSYKQKKKENIKQSFIINENAEDHQSDIQLKS